MPENKYPPHNQGLRFRIEMTVSCHDCDEISKVPDAGEVIELHGDKVQLMHNGLKVVAGAYGGDWTREIIGRLHGHHEPQEELVFHHLLSFLPENARMIELGSFWSYYSIWFLLKNPGRKALGIEPDPAHIEIGRKNAELNGVELELRSGFLASEGPESADFQTEDSGIVTLPRIDASELCQEFAPGNLDLLHLDIQGAETAVIKDCERLLRTGEIRFLVVSTHCEWISGSSLTHQDCLEMILEFGGRILEEHDVHESFSGDGLIAAYFGKEDLNWRKLNMSRNRYSSALFRNPVYDRAEARNEYVRLLSEHERVLGERSHALSELEASRKGLSILGRKLKSTFDRRLSALNRRIRQHLGS